MEKKRKVRLDIYNSVTLLVYVATYFSPQKRLIYKKKSKVQQKLRASYGCRQVGAGHEHLKKLCCYLNIPDAMLSNNYQNY